MSTRPERFHAKYRIEPETNCWLWTANHDADGYGRFYWSANKRSMPAHRAAWMLMYGRPIPQSAEIDHLCRNRACVNPRHLEPVSHDENMKRGDRTRYAWRRDIVECPKGHPYDGENTYVSQKTGQRNCRACGRENAKRYRAA